MISVLMSEGLAPSNGAKPHEPAREASRPSKDEKFSSYMDSKDDTPEVDPKDGAETTSAIADAPPKDDQSTADRSASKGDLAETAKTNAENPSPETADLLTLVKTADAAEGADALTTPAEEALVRSAAPADDAASIKPDDTKIDTAATDRALNTAQAVDEAARVNAGEADTADTALIKSTPEADAEIKFDQRAANATVTDGDAAPTKFADTSGQSSDDGQKRQTLDPAQATPKTETQIAADSGDQIRTGDLADLDARKQTVTDVSADKLVQTNFARDAAPVTSEPLLAVAASSSTNSAGPVSTGGLAPTVPTQVIAAPNELTSVIMNALKGGGDVQEQLVVQLDPPELGRVLIDFKFDAQGLQQITVTSENPEALKRLRELHFELTEALKQQGLSDSNLSFQQEAQDQSQQNWQASDWGRAQSQVVAVADRESSAAAMPAPPQFQGRDRLDLLL